MDFLKHIGLFRGLSDEDYDYLYQYAEVIVFEKDELIFKKGERAEHLFVVRKGFVKLSNIRKGTLKEEIVCLIKPNEFYCLAPLLSRELLHIDAWAIEHSEVLKIPKKTIVELIERSHIFSKNVISFLAGQECNLCEEVCDLSLSTTKERLAKYLLKEFKKHQEPGALSIPMNQAQLASYLGTVRETVSRDLGALKKARVIETKKGKITLIDADELVQIANGGQS